MKKKLGIILVIFINFVLIGILLIQEAFLSIYSVENLEILSRDLDTVQKFIPTQDISQITMILLKNRDLITISCLSIMGVTILVTLILIISSKNRK